MLPQPLLAPVVSTIFRKMADIYNCQVGAWQRQFLRELFKAVLSLRGRVNFTNLARFGPLHEQTFHRHFEKAFRWVWFNLTVFRLRQHPEEPIIGVFDCSFLPKSGTETWGLDRFFSSLAGRSKQGLEVSVLGLVATGSRRAFGVDATQTPPDLSTDQTGGYSRVDFYLEQIVDLYNQLADLGVSYWVTGGFYAKQKVFDTAGDLGGDLITRLRSDANLRHLYTGPPKEGPGAPKQYDGKIDWDDPEALTRRFDEVGHLPDQPQVRILTTVANSPHFGRDLRVVLLVGPDWEEQVLSRLNRYRSTRRRSRPLLSSALSDRACDPGCKTARRTYPLPGSQPGEARLPSERVRRSSKCAPAPGPEGRVFAPHLSPRSLQSTVDQRAFFQTYVPTTVGVGLSAEYDRTDPRVQAVVHTGRMAV